MLAGSPVRDSNGNLPSEDDAKRNARRRIDGWNNTIRSAICGPRNNIDLYPPENGMGSARCRDSDFVGWTQTAAEEVCTARGYERAVNTQDDYTSEVWEYTRKPPPQAAPNTYNFDTRRTRTYETTCERKVRKRVRR